ncbi:proteoglycan 4 isoform X1 [Mus caroli]|uniref:Proteoglycan 4 isoform X1 n=1 Tax=Mus caroli TaxID=10089 RepID=A0A6P5P5X1_MUSCR|nr:proteoglycan 4 isoform X1 [Mus caroli]XP_021010291.1 proteoglycan 4 isoform X1 [Mus caroli]
MGWKILPICLSLLLPVVLIQQVSSQDLSSCAGRCGEGYSRDATCNCDYNCQHYMECCPDFKRVCTTELSCKGRCFESFARGRECDCDSQCKQYGKCCADYDSFCEEVKDNKKNTPKKKPNPEPPAVDEAGSGLDNGEFKLTPPPPDPPTTPHSKVTTSPKTTAAKPVTPKPSLAPNSETSKETSLASNKETTVETKETTATNKQSSASKKKTTSAKETRSAEKTSDKDVEPTSTIPKNSAPTTTKKPVTTTKEPVPTTPKEPEPTTPKEPEPTTPKEPEPTTPKEPEPTTPKESEPTTPKESEPTTPKESEPTTTSPKTTTLKATTLAPKVTAPAEEIQNKPEETTPASEDSDDSKTTLKPQKPTKAPKPTKKPTKAPKKPTSTKKPKTAKTRKPKTTPSPLKPTSATPELNTTPLEVMLPTTTIPKQTPNPETAQVNPDHEDADGGEGEKPLIPGPPVLFPTAIPGTDLLVGRLNQGININPMLSDETNLCNGKPVDGLTTLRNGTLVAFRGHYFWMLNPFRPPSPPRRITEVWGIPSPIDTVFTRCNCEGKTFFFKDSQYWRFTNDVVDPGYPKQIVKGFGGLTGKIVAALSIAKYKDRPESVYFFKRGGNIQQYTYKQEPMKKCTGRRPAINYSVYGEAAQVRRRRFERAVGPFQTHTFRIHYSVPMRVSYQDKGFLHNEVKVSTMWRGFPNVVTSAITLPNIRKPDGYDYYAFSKDQYYNIDVPTRTARAITTRSGQTLSKIWYNCP